MKKNKKAMPEKVREQKQTKAKALERESNLTLISTSVAIVSFFLMLYVHNIIKTNFLSAQTFLTVFEILFLAGAVVLALIAIIKKKNFLWEYVIVFLVLSAGYYLLENGVSGIPGMMTVADGSVTISKAAVFLAKFINSQTVIYALWAFNVIYCVATIVYHSVKYTKIKKGSN